MSRGSGRLALDLSSTLQRPGDVVEDFAHPTGTAQRYRAVIEDAPEDALVDRDRLDLPEEELQRTRATPPPHEGASRHAGVGIVLPLSPYG